MKTRPSPRIKTAFENERFEDDLRKQLADLAHNIKVTPSNTVNNKENFSILLPDPFIEKYTDYSTLDEFFKAANIANDEDLKNMPEEKLDSFVKEHTKFDTWQHMQDEAVNFLFNK